MTVTRVCHQGGVPVRREDGGRPEDAPDGPEGREGGAGPRVAEDTEPDDETQADGRRWRALQQEPQVLRGPTARTPSTEGPYSKNAKY